MMCKATYTIDFTKQISIYRFITKRIMRQNFKLKKKESEIKIKLKCAKLLDV